MRSTSTKTLLVWLCLWAPVGLADEATGPVAQLTLEDLRTFTDVFEQIRSNYVDEIDDATLLRAAIQGMVDITDGYSTFIDASEFEALAQSTRGETGGIGATIMIQKRMLVVQAVHPGGPSDRAGMRAGDVIAVIDEEPVRGRRLAEAIDALEGEAGSEVILQVLRRDQAARMVTLVRETVPVASVFAEWLEPGLARIRISHFHQQTHEEFQQRLLDLQQSAEPPLRGLVIDLRENLGGEMQSAVRIADGFLDAGLIARTESRYEATRLNFHAQPGQWAPGVSVALLVDGLTASSSEILVAALQDHDRAMVIGKRTYGKGIVQSVMRLRNGSALKLTTARYFTPLGRSLHDEGIEPDISAETPEDFEREALTWLRARAGDAGA